MAISIADIVTRARIQLEDTPWETTLSEALNATQTTINVPDGTDWDKGDIGEIRESGEQFLVRSVATNTLTVVRGYNQTTAATAAISGRLLKVPVFSDKQLTDAVTRVIGTLWPYAYKIATGSLTVNADTVWYNAPASTLMALIRVSQLYGASSQHVGIYGKRYGRPITIERNLPTALVATGIGLRFPQGLFHASNAITVKYAAKITGTSDIEEGHVAEALLYLTIAEVVGRKESGRVTLEDVDQGDQSVGPGQRIRSATYWRQLGNDELNLAHEELRLTAPVMAEG